METSILWPRFPKICLTDLEISPSFSPVDPKIVCVFPEPV